MANDNKSSDRYLRTGNYKLTTASNLKGFDLEDIGGEFCSEKRKGRDIGYALAASSCEEA
jgi:hypothetical protein